MKFQFDLLPQEYKCLPKDSLGIVLGVFALLACLSASTFLYLKNTADFKEYDKEFKAIVSEINENYDAMKGVQKPIAEIDQVKGIIAFIQENLEHPGSSWVDFLFAFEKTVPENVFVKDINPKDFSGVVKKFVLNGEAVNIEKILEFIQRLQQSDRFNNVFLMQNSVVGQLDQSVVQFSLEFNYVAPK